jgi:hypothetical protein
VQVDIVTDYNNIKQTIDTEIDNENDRQDLKSSLEDVKSEIKNGKIPHSGIIDKFKKFDKLYYMLIPWMLKAVEEHIRNG